MNKQVARGWLYAGGVSFALLWSGTALADAISQVQSLDFLTEDQSLWGPGGDSLAGMAFTHTFIDKTIPQTTIGKITGTIQVPNPLRTVFDAAVDACDSLGSVLGPPCVAALGQRPSATITLQQKNGMTLTFSGGLNFGLSGGISLDAGKVDAGYTTTATIGVDDSKVVPGQTVTIHTAESGNSTSLTTQFAGVDANLGAHLGIKAKADATAFVANVGGTLPILNIDKTFDPQLLTVGLHGPDAVVDFPVLGTPPVNVPVGIKQNVGIPLGPGVSVPLLSHKVHLPELNSSQTVAGSGVTTDIEPISRLCGAIDSCPTNPTDYEQLSINLAALGLLAEVPLGLTVGIPLVIKAEADVIKADFSLIGEFSQKLNFEPNPTVTLNFNQPTQVEIAPGVFEFMLSDTIPIGQDVNLIQPNSDLVIDPVYSLANNTFSNDTEWLLQFLQSFDFEHFALSGAAPSLVGLSGEFSMLTANLPLGSPLDLGPLSDTTPFSLEGFEDVAGDPFTLAALIEPGPGSDVPEPRAIFTFLTALLGIVVARRQSTDRRAIAMLFWRATSAEGRGRPESRA